MQLDLIQAPVKTELQAVNTLLYNSLASGVSLIDDIGKHALDSGGKRLRPLLLLLIAKDCGYQGEQHILLAAIVELIHTATLLHDDVVDSSARRRGRETANVRWGDQSAVLAGDFMFTKAFQMLIELGNLDLMDVLINTTNKIVEGEAQQLRARHNLELTEDQHLAMIQAKTAVLFEACAKLAALLGQVNPTSYQALSNFGLHFGTAFQIMDDLLDYTGSESKTGKPLGNDFLEGKITLPVLYALQHATQHDITQLREAFQKPSPSDFTTVQEILETCGAFQYVNDFAEKQMQAARAALANLPTTEYLSAALDLADFSLSRTY